MGGMPPREMDRKISKYRAISRKRMKIGRVVEEKKLAIRVKKRSNGRKMEKGGAREVHGDHSDERGEITVTTKGINGVKGVKTGSFVTATI